MLSLNSEVAKMSFKFMNVNYNLFLWIKYLSTKFSFLKLMVPMDETVSLSDICVI